MLLIALLLQICSTGPLLDTHHTTPQMFSVEYKTPGMLVTIVVTTVVTIVVTIVVTAVIIIVVAIVVTTVVTTVVTSHLLLVRQWFENLGCLRSE